MALQHTEGAATARLRDLGHALPHPGPDDPKYTSFQRLGDTIFIAGQLPYANGTLATHGLLGRDVSVEQARDLARIAALNALGVAAAAVGSLDQVRVVQMLVFVASTAEFAEQSKVADAASELLVTVLGANGRHARTAIGVAALPRNSPIEIQMVCADASRGQSTAG